MTKTPKIAISVGEPAGIGPDQLILACLDNYRAFNAILVAFCDPNLLYQRAANLKVDIEIINIKTSDLPHLSQLPKKTIYVLDSADGQNKLNNLTYKPGSINNKTALNTLSYLKSAVHCCLDGSINALVTCPIQKSVINTILPNFTGHTEYLEELCQNSTDKSLKSVMMLMCPSLKTALVTTHIPLSKVATSINIKNIMQIVEILDKDLKFKFNIKKPRILITGLNPHAGENGNLGTEEIDIIIPAIKQLKARNINVSGPYAADSIFSSNNLGESDIILAMYHDQGLTGFKAKSFNTAANITLGLPIIRTSVDHGTALELAGTSKINNDSFIYATQMAIQLSLNSST